MRTRSHYPALAALIGCAAPTEAPPPGAVGASLTMCERYRDTIPNAYERCLVGAAQALPTAEAMTTLCAHAGALLAECHAQWVDHRGRVGDLSGAALLAACGPSDDCTLRVLDNHPNPDVIAQMALCDQAGAYRGFCIGHAVRRWAEAVPDAAELHRVAAAADTDADVVGPAIGMLVACHGAPVCPKSSEALAVSCAREQAAASKDRSRCYGGAFSPAPQGPRRGR